MSRSLVNYALIMTKIFVVFLKFNVTSLLHVFIVCNCDTWAVTCELRQLQHIKNMIIIIKGFTATGYNYTDWVSELQEIKFYPTEAILQRVLQESISVISGWIVIHPVVREDN